MNLSIPEVLLAIFIYDVFKEGILKKIQVLIAAKLVSNTNSHIQKLKDYADETCTEIDDLLVSPLASVSGNLDRIINKPELSPADQRVYRQLVTERYQLSLLLKKLGVGEENNGED